MSKRFETVAVPFQIDAEGRQVLTDAQLRADPYLEEFVERFSECFERDHKMCIWVWKEHDDGKSA